MKNRSLPLPFPFFLFLSVLLLFPARTDAVPTERTEVLTLQQALELAFAAHPDLAGGAAALRSAAGSEERAGARPSLSASGSHTSREREDSQSASLKVQQLLSDGGKTAAAVRAAQRSEDAAASDLESLRNTLAYEVRIAYYELVRARQELQVAQEMVALHEKHLDKAKALLAAGASPKSDVTAAEVDLSRSRLDLATARADAARAAAALENAMGLRSDGARRSMPSRSPRYPMHKRSPSRRPCKRPLPRTRISAPRHSASPRRRRRCGSAARGWLPPFPPMGAIPGVPAAPATASGRRGSP
jgi:cobalt-zinc-cadmium efflux system outer membrane protein